MPRAPRSWRACARRGAWPWKYVSASGKRIWRDVRFERHGGGGGSRTCPYSFRFSKLLKTLYHQSRSNCSKALSEVRIEYAVVAIAVATANKLRRQTACRGRRSRGTSHTCAAPRSSRRLRSGLWMYYSIAPAKSEFHRKLLDCLTACFTDVPELKKDATRAQKVRRDGGCCPT
jgi:hypothetical protein